MKREVRVVPAILTDDSGALEKLVRKTETFTDYAQFDIMDGKFVPSLSVTDKQIAALEIKLTWEVHLMVLNPEKYLKSYQQAGAQKIVFHYEATPHPERVISEIRELGVKVGIALNPETPIYAIAPLVAEVDSVLFLTVNPGFYGSKFLPEVLDKVDDFRKAYPDMEIGVDGGIKEGNIGLVAWMGVDVIFVGSAISLQPDPAEAYRRLLKLAQEGARRRES